MKKRKHEKNFIRNRSGGMKQKLPGRLLSLVCALVLVLSTVFLDLGHISAYAFGDELYLETEAEETAEAGAEAQAADLGNDESQINTELSEDISEDPAEVSAEEAEDASEADFSSGDNLDEQELTTEEPGISDDSAAETITYTQLINNDTVEVRAEAPAGALPEGTELVVKEIKNNTDDAEMTEQYNRLSARITEQLQNQGKNLDGFLPYNISFTDMDGNPVKPSKKVTYSFRYTEATAPELTDPSASTVTAAQLKENKETAQLDLTELKAEENKLSLETNESRQLQRAAFQAADNAVYTFIWSNTPAADNNGEADNEETQEPESEPTQIGTIRLLVDEVNLRTAPSIEADVIGTADAGTELPLLEIITAEDGSTWYKVFYSDTVVYVSGEVAEVVEAEEAPTEEAPAEITRYDYQSDEVNVKVTLIDPADLPDNAELSVTPVELSQEAEEQIAEEAIKEKKAIENIRSYDIKFLVDGEEVQPGATVKVEVSFPDEETAQDAAVYHVDQDEKVENMDGSINKEGNVEFETTHFSTYVIVNKKTDGSKITVTVQHYEQATGTEEAKKIYADDVRELQVGQQVDCKKALNWNIAEVKVNTGGSEDKTVTPDASGKIYLAQNATVKVYYTPSIGTTVGTPTFYDYTVKAVSDGDASGYGYPSINQDSSYPNNASSERITVGAYTHQYSGKYQYTWKKGGHTVNDWTGSSAVVRGLLGGVKADDSVVFNYSEPGLFVNSDMTDSGSGKSLRKVYKDFKLGFERNGDTYTLKEVRDSSGTDVAGANGYDYESGNNFFPLDGVAYDEHSKKLKSESNISDNVHNGPHNYYFGMRYDITFNLKDYIGDLNYSFTGDDDMWVVLDKGKYEGSGKVIIDLGGIHDAASADVDLWKELFGSEYAKEAPDKYIKRASLTEDQKNEEHTLTVLYLERGAGLSNCKMNFTLPNAEISPVTTTDLASFTFTKVKKDNKTPLPGATFKLYTDSECTTEFKTKTSGENGTVTFDKLFPGTYYMKEVQAPEGYIASSEVWTVEVPTDSTTATLKDSKGNTVTSIINETPEEVIKSSMEFNKTAKVKDWNKRTYDIEITASSTSTSTSDITKKVVADIMLVLDVSGSMKEPTYKYTYVADNTDAGRKNLNKGTTYYIEVDGSYQSLEYYYSRYNGYNWYVGDNSNNKATDSKYSNCKIYSRSSQTRLAALQNAVDQFIRDTAAKSPNSKIGITAFSSTHESNVNNGSTKEMLSVGSNKDSLIEFANSLKYGGGTKPAIGLNKAKELLDKEKNDNPKYVVLFTDGAPTGDRTDNVWDSDAVSNANTAASQLREAGYTVYTIGFALGDKAAKFLAGDGTTNYPGIASPGCAKTADTATSLGEIFKEIQQTITNNIDLTGVRIKDVIDPRFEILGDNGQPITTDNVGNGVKLKNGGTVKFDDAGNQYIEWTDQTIPNKVRGEWKHKVTVKAKDNYIGGNNVTTNAPGSMIDTGYEQVDLPFPAVNVKVNMEVANKTVTIYKGDQTPTEAEILNQLFDKTNTTTSYDDVKVDATEVMVKWYRDKGCTDEIKNPDMEGLVDHPAATTEYYIKVTYDAGKPTTESNGNTGGNFAGTETGDTCIASATNVDDRDKETKRTYGVYKVEVKSGEIGITKNLVDQVGKPVTSAEDQEFTFKVTKKSEDGNVDEKFTPVEVKITVPAGQTTASLTDVTKLTNLSRGIYEVEEIKVPKEYKTAGADVIVKNNQTAGTDCKYSIADDNSYKVTFKLGYKMDNSATDTDVIKVGNDANGKKCYTYDEKDGGVKGLVAYSNTLVTTDLDLKKVDKDGRNNLTGARFKLEKWEVAEGENEDSWKSVSDAYDSITVDNGGDARELLNLLAGRYRLTEIEAPKGYSLLGASIYFKVEDGKVTLTDKNGTNKEATQTMWTLDEGNLVLTIKNTELYSLPSSGGPGIYGFTISGVAFITAALLLFINNKRKEDEAKFGSTH